MRDKFNRAKYFVRRHRVAIAYSVGVVAGSTATYSLVAKYPNQLILTVEPELLQKLIDSPEGGVVWENRKRVTTLISTANPKLT